MHAISPRETQGCCRSWKQWAAVWWGVAAAIAGGWFPARQAQRLPLAQSLKGLGQAATGSRRHLASLALVGLGAALALLPPVAGIPLGAYLSVALLLVGGITALPAAVAWAYDGLAPRLSHRLLPLLAITSLVGAVITWVYRIETTGVDMESI